MASPSPTHDHIDFVTESIASVRACTGCGALIPSALTTEHQAFHDSIAQLRSAEAAASTPAPPAPASPHSHEHKPKKSKSKNK